MASNGKENVTTSELRAIRALTDKGLDPTTVASVLKLPKAQVLKILKTLDTYTEKFVPATHKAIELSEKISDFERVLHDKKKSSELGEKFFRQMTEMAEDYEASWQADSICKFKWPSKWIGIVAMSDFHIGHEGIAYKRLEHDMKMISQTQDMFMTFLGDSIDNFIDAKHLGAIINSVTSPKQQLYMLQYVLSLLKNPKAKILFVTKDNHVTARLKKATGIDWSNKMWSDYGVFYGGEEIRCEVTLGKQQYTFLGRHSARGQSNVNLTAGAEKLIKDGMYDDIDVVMVAHKHEGAMKLYNYRGKPRVAIQTSTYKILDPFAASLGFQKPSVFMPVLLCNPDKKEFLIIPSIDTAAEMLKMLNKGR